MGRRMRRNFRIALLCAFNSAKMILRELINALETFAPLSLQESYDNSGLIYGNPEHEVESALLSLDCTEAVIDEAIDKGCKLVISHHPIIFSGLKKITGKSYVERTIIKAIQSGTAIYAIHTNLDNVYNGVNGKICEKLGLEKTRILQPMSGKLKKIVVFVPHAHAENVRKTMFEAGAGYIGQYDECSFNTSGEGTFRPLSGSNPFVGEQGKRQLESEIRIEMIVESWKLNSVLAAMQVAHPYEEVAFDVLALENEQKDIGMGMIGEFKDPMGIPAFLDMLKREMKVPVVKYTQTSGEMIRKVAVCGGSGSFLTSRALAVGADAFVTSDIKYHEFFDGEGRLLIADIGHFESEQYTSEILNDFLAKKFPTFATHFSAVRTNPVHYFL